MATKRKSKAERDLEEAVAAARYFGAEYQANPGSSRSEYMESIAMKLGQERWFSLTPEQRRVCGNAFEEGRRAEKKLQEGG
jgi:acyl-CoA reductase-like NAD-dependent aldehyde dehydrogenase